MKASVLLILMATMTAFVASCGSSDPFKDYGTAVREATVEETEPPVPPGINSNSILLTPSKRIFLFEEGVESAYELNARVFIPDAEFELELVSPPEGMTIELKSEFNTDILVSNEPSVEGEEEDVATDETDVAEEEELPPPSMTNQKIYVVKWKPGYDTIPDDSINSIQRFVSVRFKVDEDISTIWEIPYEVMQSERQLKIVSADTPNEFPEGERTRFKVYVEYPNFSGPTFPQVAVLSKPSTNSTTGCNNLQNWIRPVGSALVNDPSSPNDGLLEYEFEANFTDLDITTSTTTCTAQVMVQDTRSVSAPYDVQLRVSNVMSAPQTTWTAGHVLEFEQGTQSAYSFLIFGKEGEGEVDLEFVSPCKAVFSGQGDCKCQRESGVANRHIMSCTITADHSVFDSSVEYTINMRAKVVQHSNESQLVTIARKIRFYPPGTKNTDAGVGVAEETDADATVTPSGAQSIPNGGSL